MTGNTNSRHSFHSFVAALGLLAFVAGSTANAAQPTCGKARTKIDRLDCGERISFVINKVCATTTIKAKKTQMVGIEVVAEHPGVSGAMITIYEKGSLGTSMSRLIKRKAKGATPGKPFVIADQSYNKEGPGGFKKIWAVTDAKGTLITKLLLKIQLSKGGKVCKKELSLTKLWGTKWWDDTNSERDEF